MLDLTKITFKSALFKSSRGGAKITHIILHTAQGTKAGTLAWFANKACGVSAHYLIGKDGSLTQMVKLEDKAWHACNANPFSIGIEHEGFIADRTYITPAMWRASTELTAALCKRFQIPVTHVIQHSDPWLKQFKNNHQDMGPIFDQVKYRLDVQKILDSN